MNHKAHASLAAVAVALVAASAAAQPAEAPPPQPPPAEAQAPAPPPGSQAATAAAPAPTGQAAQVINLIERACQPLIQGADIKAVAKEVGLRRSRDTYILRGEGVQEITLEPPTVANPTVCRLRIEHEIDQSGPIMEALGNWAAAQNPPIPPLSAGHEPAPGLKSWSWAGNEGGGQHGIVFTAQKNPDGTPIEKGRDVSIVLYSRSAG